MSLVQDLRNEGIHAVAVDPEGDKIMRMNAETARIEGGGGTVKWCNVTKGFGFVIPDGGGKELFLHRSVLEHAGLTNLAEGTRVRFQTVEGKKGTRVGVVALL